MNEDGGYITWSYGQNLSAHNKRLAHPEKLLATGILMDVKLPNVGGLHKNLWKSGDNHRFSSK